MIQLLPDHIANQIAAGEVVQRPASVLKELLENAVDAGATIVNVIATDAGRTLLQVVDNGSGMNAVDARMAFERHATSKIHAIDDLQRLHTFGFRGEALASIAAVSEIILLTRRAEDEVGSRVHILAGEPPRQTAAATATGTSISVKNLFYNIPARRKFLKSDATEFNHIVDEFSRVALCHPEVEFKLTHNNQECYHLPSSNLRQRIVNFMGKPINQQLIDVNVPTSMVNINGFIGKPDSAKRNNNKQFFFVNGRYFRSPYLQKAVTTAYERLLPATEVKPSLFIYFEIDPANIDVNIHPAKTEIKFEDESVIFRMLNAAVREALAKFAIAPSIDFDTEGAPEIPTIRKNMPPPSAPKMNFDPHFNPFEEEKNSTNTRDEEMIASCLAMTDKRPFSKPEIDKNWEKLYENTPVGSRQSAVGSQQLAVSSPGENEDSSLITHHSSLITQFIQLRGKYLLIPVKSGVMVIDIRRAKQRIYYEQYIRLLANHQHASQQQIFAETVALKHEDYLLLEPVLDNLRLLGYDINAFGNNTIAINGWPANIPVPDIHEWIDNLLAELREASAQLKERRQTTLAASLARTAAGNSTEALQPEEAQTLIDHLFACETPSVSPSGKPAVHIIPMEELDKKLLKN